MSNLANIVPCVSVSLGDAAKTVDNNRVKPTHNGVGDKMKYNFSVANWWLYRDADHCDKLVCRGAFSGANLKMVFSK